MSSIPIYYDWNSTELCPRCYYGSECQFTTLYYSISLEALLYTSLQSTKIFLILFIGIICNTVSIVTFCQKTTRELISGLYRLWIAIIGQLGTIILIIRVFIMLNKKNTGIINCFVLDYLISVLSSLHYSLTACMAIEKIVVAYKHLSFDKEGSRHKAKIIIPILIIYHFLIAFYKLFQYQLRADLHSTHNYYLSTFEKILNIIHLILPIIFNLFSPIILIIILVKHKITLKPDVSLWSNFKEVLYTYRRNIISPYILVIFTIPYLIVTFYFNCITQSWQNQLYLSVYLIYLIPLMTSLFIFILPSPKCREELYKMYHRLISYIYSRRY
ncbi:unnamed protein product [Adineta steineri]|uniref:Uncharacterized protein n=1 Tax=Adineta steineri TaxID=433720 RepID=A0A819NL92_9BILA|nr:unnamed protein product [Adineta steineri]CAF0769827.1 unnamed protein product [Adineta steineri]CAF3894700.1 unnamed protein product [Adineta steineri]CAF4000011.1 unnamed protein product [Adineta steineri]